MQNKHEVRSEAATKKEVRSIGELRSIEVDGTFEGYLTVWGTVDDYNSTFTRGSFAKTIQERGSKVKVFFDHEHLVGSSIELREDDHGVFARGKLNLAVRKAEEAYAFMKDGTLEGLSFGFRTIKQSFVNGVTEIREVKLFEYGPVTFPANDAALITDVRSENFDESLMEEKLYEEGSNLRYALSATLNDIWFNSDSNAENVIGKLDDGLAKFHAAYLDYARRWIDTFWMQDSQVRSTPLSNTLANAVGSYLQEAGKSIEQLATETSFTSDELTELRQGRLIENRGALSSLSETVVNAHREQRNAAVETLCKELRGKFTEAETTRIAALLAPVAEKRQSEPELDELMNYFKQEQTIGETHE